MWHLFLLVLPSYSFQKFTDVKLLPCLFASSAVRAEFDNWAFLPCAGPLFLQVYTVLLLLSWIRWRMIQTLFNLRCANLPCLFGYLIWKYFRDHLINFLGDFLWKHLPYFLWHMMSLFQTRERIPVTQMNSVCISPESFLCLRVFSSIILAVCYLLTSDPPHFLAVQRLRS